MFTGDMVTIGKLGYYIQGPIVGKAEALKHYFEAEIIDKPINVSAIPEGKALIIVTYNPSATRSDTGEHRAAFESAVFAYNQAEFDRFHSDFDQREKTYVTMDVDTVLRLIGIDQIPTGPILD